MIKSHQGPNNLHVLIVDVRGIVSSFKIGTSLRYDRPNNFRKILSVINFFYLFFHLCIYVGKPLECIFNCFSLFYLLLFFCCSFFLVSLNALQKFLQSLQISAGIGVKNGEANEEEKEKPVQLLDEVTFEGIAKFIRSGRCEFMF